jgi:hypothetical protein
LFRWNSWKRGISNLRVFNTFALFDSPRLHHDIVFYSFLIVQ